MSRHANLRSWWTVKYRLRSNIHTAVSVVIPKYKLIPSIITVAYVVPGKWTWTSGSKLRLMQVLMDWQMTGPMDEQTENLNPISGHAKSRRDKN